MWTIALIVFFGLIALVVLGVFTVPLFLPKSYRIEKSIIVKASPQRCYDQVADLNQYAGWNPWRRLELEASYIIEGVPKTAGHRYAWDGKKVGTGSITVTKLAPPAAAELALEFVKPFRSKALDSWKFEAEGDATRITWINEGALSYPVARLMGPFISKSLDRQFAQGLENIREICEK